ncbi:MULTISPECIES: hypothetical protein [Aurantimonas]|uniref:hypothetical protein n=1 Tax=Aurantimonas TaxID=182269 RepID=UPI003514E940
MATYPPIYLNWKGPAGRETIDEVDRATFGEGREGFKACRAEVRRLIDEYALAGMPGVYSSSRPCANWRA